MNTTTTLNRPSNLMQSIQPDTRKSAPAPTQQQEFLEFRHFTALINLFNHPRNLAQYRISERTDLLANSVRAGMKSGAATKITMARVWLVMLVLSVGLLGIASGQACPRTFFSALVQLMPCRLAVASFNPAPPSEACCNAVKTLGQPCLCALVNGPPVTGVDRYMAMQLPVKCTVDFEPCKLSSSSS